MAPVKVFLDANILFSAALGGETFALLWELGRAGLVQLCTSRYCMIEAEENLARKRPAAVLRYHERLEQVLELPNGDEQLAWASSLLPPKDAPVLAAAVSAGCVALVTGDVRDFGHLMRASDLPLRVRTVHDFLLEGPPTA